MDNGGSLIDVIDESELFEPDPSTSDFSWADDFISSSETIGAHGGLEIVTCVGSHVANSSTGQLATQHGIVIQQNPQLVRTNESHAGGVQVIQANHGLVQQKEMQQSMVSNQQVLSSNIGNILQGSGNQIIQGANGQLILKTANGQQILLQTQPSQQLQQVHHGQSPSPSLHGSPMVSRSHTPSQSPVPISSPQIGHSVTPVSRSMTPNQSSSMTPITMVTAAKNQGQVFGNMAASNVNVLQLQGSSQSQPVLTRNIPLQGVIQMGQQNVANAINLQGQNALIQGQGNQILQPTHGAILQQNQGQATLLPGQGQNIVNTQNTVIQNPNVVNVNVAHVLCNNQLQNQQGSTVHHMSNIQGTLIQTPDGKYIITQNPQLAQGQQVNFQNIPQVTLQPQVNVGSQTTNQTAAVGQAPGAVIQGSVSNATANVGNLGNVLRIAAPQQVSQDKNVAAGTTHFIGVNQHGQQVLIQRTPTPTGQQQNVILRTVNPSNFVQIQQQTASSSVVSTQSTQVTQPLIMPSQQQQLPYQKVITTPQGQQVKFLSQGGTQASAPVTLNLSGQNINLQGANALQTIQFIQQQQQILQQQQVQQQQVQKQVTSSTGMIPSTDLSNQENRTVSPSLGLTQNVSSGISSSQGYSTNQTAAIISSSSNVTQQFNQQNIFAIPSGTAKVNASPQIQQIKFATTGGAVQHIDNQVHKSPQQLAQSLQNIQIPLTQFSAVNPPNLSTASATVVTTTVSQPRIQVSQINVTSSPIFTQSVQPTSSITTSPKPPVLQARINAPKLTQSVFAQKLQQIQAEIKKYSTMKNLTTEQKRHYMALIEAQSKIDAQNQLLSSKTAQTVQASVVQAASKLLPDGQQQQVLVQQAGQPQVGFVASSQGQPTSSVQFQQQRPLITQAGARPTIAGNQNLVNQTVVSTSSLSPSIAPSSSISSVTSIPVPVQSLNTRTSQQQQQPIIQQQQPVVQNSNIVPSQVPQSLLNTIQIGTGGNQSTTATTTTSSAVKLPVPTTVVHYNAPPGKVPIPASPQVPVSTQVKIGNHILTLNLTPQQKEKVQGYLANMTPEQQQAQISLFLRLQSQQQLQNQIRAQVQNQQTQKLLSSPSVNPVQQSKIPTTVQVQQSPEKVTAPPVDNQQTVLISAPGQKLTRLSVASIPKSQLIQQQLNKDQANALNPDVKTPFKTRRDTYRRLLRYHVYQSRNTPESAMQIEEEKFEEISGALLRKKQSMLNRFHMLLLQESMREKPTSEVMMLQRLVNEDIKQTIKEEKELVKENPDSLETMPLHILEKKETLPFKKRLTLVDNVNNSSATELQKAIKVENIDSDDVSQMEIKSELMDEKPATPKLRLLIKSDGENFSSSMAPGSDEDNSSNVEISAISDKHEADSKSQNESNQNLYTGLFSDSLMEVKQEPVDDFDTDKWQNLDDNKPFQQYFNTEDSQMACDSDSFVSSAMQMMSHDSVVDSISGVNSNHDDVNDSVSLNSAHSSPNQTSSAGSPSNNLSNISDDSTSIHDNSDNIAETLQAVKGLDQSTSDQNFYSELNRSSYSSSMVFESHPDDYQKSHFSNQNTLSECIDISDASQQSENHFGIDVVTSLSDNVQNAVDNLMKSNHPASLGQYEPISSPEADHEDSFSNFKLDSSYSVTIGDRKLGYNVPVSMDISETDRSRQQAAFSEVKTDYSQQQEVNMANNNWGREESEGEPDPLVQSAINSILSLNQESSSRPTTPYDYNYDHSSNIIDSNFVNQADDNSFGEGVKNEDISEEEMPIEDDLDAAVNSILF